MKKWKLSIFAFACLAVLLSGVCIAQGADDVLILTIANAEPVDRNKASYFRYQAAEDEQYNAWIDMHSETHTVFRPWEIVVEGVSKNNLILSREEIISDFYDMCSLIIGAQENIHSFSGRLMDGAEISEEATEMFGNVGFQMLDYIPSDATQSELVFWAYGNEEKWLNDELYAYCRLIVHDTINNRYDFIKQTIVEQGLIYRIIESMYENGIEPESETISGWFERHTDAYKDYDLEEGDYIIDDVSEKIEEGIENKVDLEDVMESNLEQADKGDDPTFEAIMAGYHTIECSDDWKTNTEPKTVMSSNVKSILDTLVRPYIVVIPDNYQTVDHSLRTLYTAFNNWAYMLSLYEMNAAGENKVSLFNGDRIAKIRGFDKQNISFDYYDYLADDDGKWEVLCLMPYDTEENDPVCDEVYVFSRFGVTRNDGTECTMMAFVTDQDAVYRIVETMDVKGEVKQWYLRRASGDTEEFFEEEFQMMKVRIRESGDVNVRAKPDAESARVGKATAGKTYDCLSVADNGWYEIVLEDGTVGFVSQKLATMTE